MRLYVGGLPYQTNDQDLSYFFEQIGPVTFSTVITDRETGRSKGFGFIEMSDEDGRTAIERLNGTTMGERTITVNEARERQANCNRGYQSRDRSSNYGGNRY